MTHAGLSAQTTYHVVLTWSDQSDRMECWLNGEVEVAEGIAWDMEDHRAPFDLHTVGMNAWGCAAGEVWMPTNSDVPSTNLRGWIDEVAVWDRVLSAGEIASHYDSGSVACYTATPTATPTSSPTATPTPGVCGYQATVAGDGPLHHWTLDSYVEDPNSGVRFFADAGSGENASMASLVPDAVVGEPSLVGEGYGVGCDTDVAGETCMALPSTSDMHTCWTSGGCEEVTYEAWFKASELSGTQAVLMIGAKEAGFGVYLEDEVLWCGAWSGRLVAPGAATVG